MKRPLGTTSTELLTLIAGVALAAVLGLGALGGAGAGAIAGESRGAPHIAAPLAAVSTEAGASRAARLAADAIDAVRRGAEGGAAGPVGPKEQLTHLPRVRWDNPRPLREVRGQHAPVEVRGRTVRLGLPDYEHENPQAFRYAEIMGGGVYRFPDVESQMGIDGFFHAWLDEPLLAKGLAPETYRAMAVAAGRAVSLKDYSLFEGPISFVLGKIKKNAEKVIRAGYASEPDVYFPGTDLFASVPQVASHELVRELARRPDVTAIVRRESGAPRAFKNVVFDTADGPVRMYADEHERVFAEGPFGAPEPIHVRRTDPERQLMRGSRDASHGAPRAPLDSPDRLVLGGGDLFPYRRPGADEVTVNVAASANPDAVGLAQRLPFRRGAFRHVRTEQLPHHALHDQDYAALREIDRVLAPGGRLELRADSATRFDTIDRRLTKLGFVITERVFSQDGRVRLGTNAVKRRTLSAP